MSLKLSNNSKTKFAKNHYNTFGLTFGLPENGGTCPGSTSGPGGCLDVRDGHKRETCYMAKLVAIYKGVGAVLLENTETLAGKTLEELKEVCRNTIAGFTARLDAKLWYFRLHYSGDFFSKDYSQAWADVIKEFPDVKFWVYTRSFVGETNFIEPLLGIPNLSLYLSADPVNQDEALALYNKYSGEYNNIGLSWLGPNAPNKEELRWVTCPETSNKIKGDETKGACAKCRLCIDNYKIRIKNIQFNIH